MIDLQFVTASGWQSQVIRFLTWSPFSHVDFKMPDGTLLGARLDGGVQIRKPDYAKFTDKAIYRADAPDSILDFARKQVGKPYDSRGILNFGLHRDWKDDSSWFCSELVAAAFEQAGMPLVNTPSAGRVTPRDLTLSILLYRIA